MSTKPHILVVEDCREVADITRRVLELDGYVVTCVENGDEALAQLVKREFDLLISDHDHPGASAAGIFSRARAYRPKMPLLLSTGYGSAEMCETDLHDPHFAFLQKPWRVEELRAAVADLLP